MIESLNTDAFVTAAALGVLGLFLGSFAGAMVWRLRFSQLRKDKKYGYEVDSHSTNEISKLHPKGIFRDRSVCMRCGHTLAWYDLIPLVSWLFLRGRCRYCRKSIGWFEPSIEIGLALFFFLSYFFWPAAINDTLSIIQFICWLVAGVGLAVLLAYDAKWFLLPDKVMFPLIFVGLVYSFVTILIQGFEFTSVVNVIIAISILSGIYYVIYVVSGHKWVGFGDVKLGLALALLLADWRLAVLTLFLANALGTVLLLPLMLSGRVKKQAHIPFGPFLIVAWFLAGIFGTQILDWYMLLILGAI